LKTIALVAALIALLAAGCGKSDLDRPPKVDFPDIEQAVFRLVNNYRESVGLNSLVWNEYIAIVCRRHSLGMASGEIPFSHRGYNFRNDLLVDMFGMQDFRENLSEIKNFPGPALATVKGWLGSRTHRANMEALANATGVGVAWGSGGYYVTQIYAIDPAVSSVRDLIQRHR
jgi:uncharacterized protein YkwD